MTYVQDVMGTDGLERRRRKGIEKGGGPVPCGVTDTKWVLVGRPKTDCIGP